MIGHKLELFETKNSLIVVKLSKVKSSAYDFTIMSKLLNRILPSLKFDVDDFIECEISVSCDHMMFVLSHD